MQATPQSKGDASGVTPESPPQNPYAYTPPPDDSANIVRWARLGITALLLIAGMHAFRDEYGSVPLIGDIDTAVHEFGHNLFMPFGWAFLGDTMVILGGSLFQVLLPLIFVGYFLFKKGSRDFHAACCCLWWVAINLIGVSIYAADARARVLTLISGLTGQEDDGHDFYNLFSRWGVLQKDLIYAGRMRALAVALFIVAIGGGVWFALWPNRPGVVAIDSDM